jgi:DNA-binding response OmpR family regulator
MMNGVAIIGAGGHMARILVVEDEPTLLETISYNLREEGYKVVTAVDGFAALDVMKTTSPDLILLDVMLPGVDGLEVCRLIRRESAVPIIMLTAKAREIDKVVGLEVGADDYITKPFGMMELIARVRAALRRSRRETQSPETFSAHGIQLDIAKRVAKVDDQPVDLRPKEFELLHLLIANRGRVIERPTLLDRIWGEDEYIDPGTVDVHIRRLREKIESDPSKPLRILTVRGVGYKFAE